MNEAKQMEQQILQQLGNQEVRSLDKLNDLMASKLSEQSTLSQIFNYIKDMRSIVLYFAEKNFKIEIAIPSYPQRSIVKQFYNQFPVLRMLPKKCRKKLFQYCDPIEY